MAAEIAVAELMEWHPAEQLPDADLTVLLWIVTEDTAHEWAAGWWDGEAWRDCASGGVVASVVTHWAEPEGPTC